MEHVLTMGSSLFLLYTACWMHIESDRYDAIRNVRVMGQISDVIGTSEVTICAVGKGAAGIQSYTHRTL